jgi:hypothetical protein
MPGQAAFRTMMHPGESVQDSEGSVQSSFLKGQLTRRGLGLRELSRKEKKSLKCKFFLEN